MLFNIKLDTTSDYMCNDEDWPKVCCDVMVECEALVDLAETIFGKEYGDGYVDTYAFIDPERRLVTDFHIIYKAEDDSQDDMTIKVTDIADQVDYFITLEEQGGKEFKEFIAEANIRIHSKRAEELDLFVAVVNKFLDDREIRIPSSDYEKAITGNWDNNGYNPVKIFGSDYDELVSKFESVLSFGLENVIKERIRALSEWADKYNPDEDYFYSVLFDAGFTGRQIEDACGEDAAEAAKIYWEEHGFI